MLDGKPILYFGKILFLHILFAAIWRVTLRGTREKPREFVYTLTNLPSDSRWAYLSTWMREAATTEKAQGSRALQIKSAESRAHAEFQAVTSQENTVLWVKGFQGSSHVTRAGPAGGRDCSGQQLGKCPFSNTVLPVLRRNWGKGLSSGAFKRVWEPCCSSRYLKNPSNH